MKKNLKLAVLMLCSAVAGVTFNNFAMSDVPPNYKVATVNVPQIVNSSEKINILKSQQKIKVKELMAFVDKARKEVDSEKDANKKKSLEDKYDKELANKKAQIDKEYAQKLTDIDKEITKTIEEIAKKNNYDLVLTSNSVVYGGADITQDIVKVIK